MLQRLEVIARVLGSRFRLGPKISPVSPFDDRLGHESHHRDVSGSRDDETYNEGEVFGSRDGYGDDVSGLENKNPSSALVKKLNKNGDEMIGVLGAGNLGRKIAKFLQESGRTVVVSCRSEKTRKILIEEGFTVVTTEELVKKVKTVVVATKPPHVPAATKQCLEAGPNPGTTFILAAAASPRDKFQKDLGGIDSSNAGRVMLDIGFSSVSVLVSDDASAEFRKKIEELFKGKRIFETPLEENIDKRVVDVDCVPGLLWDGVLGEHIKNAEKRGTPPEAILLAIESAVSRAIRELRENPSQDIATVLKRLTDEVTGGGDENSFTAKINKKLIERGVSKNFADTLSEFGELCCDAAQKRREATEDSIQAPKGSAMAMIHNTLESTIKDRVQEAKQSESSVSTETVRAFSYGSLPGFFPDHSSDATKITKGVDTTGVSLSENALAAEVPKPGSK